MCDIEISNHLYINYELAQNPISLKTTIKVNIVILAINFGIMSDYSFPFQIFPSETHVIR